MSLFTKYEVVTDGEKWALKRTRKEGRIMFLDIQDTNAWWEDPYGYFSQCWTDEATARRELRRRQV